MSYAKSIRYIMNAQKARVDNKVRPAAAAAGKRSAENKERPRDGTKLGWIIR